jgi:putative phage-type endonuclease
MILPSDVKDFIETSIEKYKADNKYMTYGTIKDSPLIREEIFQQLVLKYELKDSHLDQSSKYLLEGLLDKYILDIVTQYNTRRMFKRGLPERIETLKQLKLPEQRSQEWFDIREKMLTASSLADSLGKGHFKNRDTLLIEKSSKDPLPRFSSWIIEWGVKYEPVATTFYEKLHNLKVLEFGLVPHPEFKIFGASPDGICDIDSPGEYVGRMLEIKCPPVRKFTKEVPEHYWMQMQGQLECCDLEECDFLQVKLIEYDTEDDYQEDKVEENGILKEGSTSDNLPKGLMISFIKNENGEIKYHYEYSEFYESYENLKQWSQTIIDSYSETYDSVKYHWWKINHYECTLVHRDRDWWLQTMPEIVNFWEDVEHYRRVGNQELLDKKEKNKRKRKPKKDSKKDSKEDTKNIITINKEITEQIETKFLLDSDSD